jgi:long-chain fatty acid transport protein
MRFRAHAGRAQARWLTGIALCSLPAVVPTHSAQAQGFGLNELGSCAIARGFAATSAPCDDASTIYWNPAAATKLSGLSFYGGASAIAVKGAFTADSTGRRDAGDVPVEYPPFVALNWTPASHRYALGVAAYVPYGLTSQWGQDFVGRFSAQKAALQSIYVQPNVAFDVVPGKLSIGGGPTFDWAQLELRQSIDLSTNQAQPGVTFAQLGIEPRTEFARAQVKGSATGVGYNLGLHWQAAPTISLGARYLSKVKFKFDDADATFTQVNTGLNLYPGSPLLPAGTPPGLIVPLDPVLAGQFTGNGLLKPGQKARTQLEFPAQIQAGIAYTGRATTLSVDYAMIQWTSFETLPVDFGATSPLSRTLIEDFKNSNSIRVGLDHRFGSGMGGTVDEIGAISGRLGFAYAQTPAPDETVTPLLPDMDRFNFMGGLGIPVTKSLTIDASYLRVETEGRRGRVIERTSTSQTAANLNGGSYSLSANIFSLSLKAQF